MITIKTADTSLPLASYFDNLGENAPIQDNGQNCSKGAAAFNFLKDQSHILIRPQCLGVLGGRFKWGKEKR